MNEFLLSIGRWRGCDIGTFTCWRSVRTRIRQIRGFRRPIIRTLMSGPCILNGPNPGMPENMSVRYVDYDDWLALILNRLNSLLQVSTQPVKSYIVSLNVVGEWMKERNCDWIKVVAQILFPSYRLFPPFIRPLHPWPTEPKFIEERYGPPSVQNRFYNDKPSASANDWPPRPPQPPRWNYRPPYYSSNSDDGNNEEDGELNRLEEGATCT